MMERQGDYLGNVRDAQWEQTKSVHAHLRWNQRFKRLRQLEPSETDLEAHLPQAGDADQLGVSLVFNEFSRGGAKSGTAVDKLQEGVSVEQQVHSM
jgi:hypothetical protein